MTLGTTVKGVDNLYFRDGRYDEGFANNKVDHDVRYYGEGLLMKCFDDRYSDECLLLTRINCDDG